MRMLEIIPVILSGGSGKRLWPLSNPEKPKPLLKLPNGETTLEMALARAKIIGTSQPVCIITRENLYGAHIELNACDTTHYLLEPEPRDTTAAIACAALYWFEKSGPNAILCILPADHSIKNPETLAASIDRAQHLVKKNKIVVFGIDPASPDTRYGYIQTDGDRVTGFSEKPELSVAQTYFQDANWFWNSGIILASVGIILAELGALRPDILAACKQSVATAKPYNSENSRCTKFCGVSYGKIPKMSFDHAILEHTDKLATVNCALDWSDLGTWSAFEKLLPADSYRNRAQGSVQTYTSKKTTAISTTKPITLLGVDNLLVVEGADAILVADKTNLEPLKEIAEAFEAAKCTAPMMKGVMQPPNVDKRSEIVQKPWGSYRVLEKQSGYLVKRIDVNPGHRLSLQSHRHRAEQWMVVSGSAIATNGPNRVQLNCNEQLTINQNTIHRLENPGPTPLTIIEIQFGDILEEDDIIRYEDDFGRPITK